MTAKNLKAAGLKETRPRRRILEILENSEKKHLSAEDVYRLLLKGGETAGLATVYRVLTQFEAAGLVTRHQFEGGQSVFEFNDGLHHDHIVCVHCGRIDEFVDEVIEQRQQAIAKEQGYAMTDHSLHIYGVCSACQ